MSKMKIGVIADSHDHMDYIGKVVDKFIELKVEKVIHCGDLISPFIKRKIKKLEENNIYSVGVFGNNDGERVNWPKLNGNSIEIKDEFHEVEWNGKKIAIYHGTYPKITKNLIESQIYDLVLTGHTHEIVIEKIKKTLHVNPGELCGYLTGKATCAVIDLNKEPLEKKSVEIIEIK